VRARAGIVLVTALALAGADLVVQAVVAADPSFAHHRSHAWAEVSVGLFFLALLLARLPRFYDRIFATPDFARASSDRFFLAVPLGNGSDARTRVTRLLGASKPVAIHELPP